MVIINDGSKDKTESICKEYRDKDFRIKYFNIENHGQGYARNFGIEHSSGDFIGFCDADDTMQPNMYETLYCIISNYSADMSGCGHNDIKDGKLIQRKSDVKGVADRRKALKLFASGKYIKWTCCDKLFRRSSIGMLRFPTQKLQGEDTLFLLNFICHNNTFVYADLGLYKYYRDSSESFTKRKWGRENLGLTKFYFELYKTVENYQLNDVLDEVQARYYENLLSTFIRSSKSGFTEESKALLAHIKSDKANIKSAKALKTSYKIDLLLCAKYPKLALKLNAFYK